MVIDTAEFISAQQTFIHGRRLWLEWLAASVCPESLITREQELAGLSSVERAILTAHVGVGHMLGLADGDLAIDGFLSERAVRRIISVWWRAGSADALTTEHLVLTWRALFQIARDLGMAFELIAMVAVSDVATRMRSETRQNLDAVSPGSHRLLALVEEEGLVPISTAELPGMTFKWECVGSHLDTVRALVYRHGVAALFNDLTMLEVSAALPADGDVWGTEALELASRMTHVYLSVPGSWPGPNASDVPAWVRDVVTVRGARTYQSSAGFVSGWLLVASTEAELNAMNRWAYAGGIGLDETDESALTFVLRLEFADDDYGQVRYTYPLRNLELLNWARTLLAIGMLRVEIYKLDPLDRLTFTASFGVFLPEGIIEKARNHLEKFLPPDDEISAFHNPSSSEILIFLAQIERNFFENLGQCLPQIGEGTDLGTAYEHQLRLFDAATSSFLRGAGVDENLLFEAREALETEITKFSRPELPPLPLETLGAGRALVQFTIALDEPASLRATTAFLDLDGEVVSQSFEFSVEIDLSHVVSSIDELSQYLTEGLAQLRCLLSQGIETIVISAGAGIYNLPFHEALLGLGFRQASYTHSVASLLARDSTSSTAAAPLILGSAGIGTLRIPAVDVELAIVSALTARSDAGVIGTKLPALVHLVGHGVSGSTGYQVGLWAEAGSGPLSPARVLLDLDASETDLVFLSACSTGAGEFPVGELIGAIPFDVAFIEKGARVVVSTSAPVNDQIACLFACAFHDAMRRRLGVWDSYDFARRSVATVSFERTDGVLEGLLGQHWPTWESDVQKRVTQDPGGWQHFRISGRHW